MDRHNTSGEQINEHIQTDEDLLNKPVIHNRNAFHSFLGVERSSISLCRLSEQAQWFLLELIYSSDIHPQNYNPLNILNLSTFQNIVEYSNINIDNAH